MSRRGQPWRIRAGAGRRLAPVLAVASTLALLGLAAGGCSRRPSGPNIALIVLDTVRRDCTGAGVGPGAAADGASVTPALDRLGAAGTVFTQAYANAPWTVPSHASLFTGQLPSEHGCATANPRLVSLQPTLAELLARAGYATAAFYSNPWLADRTTGLLRGFVLRQESPVGSLNQMVSPLGDQGGRGVLGLVSQWLERRPRRQPFFLFVNFLESHLPYDPPPDYRRRQLADLPADDKVSIQWAHEFSAGLHAADAVDWSRVRRLYRGDVNTADRLLDGLLQLLRQHKLDDNTILVVTSDHGENLGEHGLVEHQFSVHETVLDVPLVVRLPAGVARRFPLPSGRDDRPVMLTDLYATLLQFAAVPPPLLPPHSRSLLTPPAAQPRPLVAEYDGPGPGLLGLLRSINPGLDAARLAPALRTLRRGDWRVTVSSDGTRALHDLRLDPGQAHDLSAREPQAAARLDSLLSAVAPLRSFTPAGGDGIDEATRRKLRSLGYVR